MYKFCPIADVTFDIRNSYINVATIIGQRLYNIQKKYTAK